jgi:hypothetical protein
MRKEVIVVSLMIVSVTLPGGTEKNHIQLHSG